MINKLIWQAILSAMKPNEGKRDSGLEFAGQRVPLSKVMCEQRPEWRVREGVSQVTYGKGCPSRGISQGKSSEKELCSAWLRNSKEARHARAWEPEVMVGIRVCSESWEPVF